MRLLRNEFHDGEHILIDVAPGGVLEFKKASAPVAV